MPIFKAVVRVTMLMEDFESAERSSIGYITGMSLRDIVDEIENDSIGMKEVISVELIPPEKVRDELLELGNDGEFFGTDDDTD